MQHLSQRITPNELQNAFEASLATDCSNWRDDYNISARQFARFAVVGFAASYTMIVIVLLAMAIYFAAGA